MNDLERRQFMADWTEAVRPAMRRAIAQLVPDLALDGSPASREDATVLLRHFFANDAAFTATWGSALNEMKIQLSEAGMVPTEEEMLLARQVILDVLDQELAAHSH